MASSSSSYVQQKYQVFLSFRGEDTRNNFTSHLHEALKRKGINTYVDYQLIRGEEISQALLTAIEKSKISIIVLSKNYASSSWCLDELSRIIECKKRYGQEVVPIFYHVDPSDVRNQKGSFEEAFAKHHERFKDETDKVEKWRAALVEVANLAGFHLLGQLNDRPESTHIMEIVKDISKKLTYKSLYDTKRLVGIDSHVKRIESFLSIDSADVRIIGIVGMGGIGKTTIAEVVYNLFFAEFDGFCFVNVKEELNHGRVHLQKKLFSEILEDKNINLGTSLLPTSIIDRLQCKKIFVVLDDVNDSTQLDLLPEKYCFGPGSRIIIISRDKQVLQQVVDEMYQVKEMFDNEALQLFSMYAFKQSHPTEDFMELSEKVIHYAKGVPLALRVVGSALYGKRKCDWEGHLNKLKKSSDPQIDNILRISYDGLDDEVKDIFLDIACFFKGKHVVYVEDILDGCYISFNFGISILVDKSLITISCNNVLEMHDLLQLMAWNIIRQESKEPGKRSRLWTPEDIYHILKNNTGTNSVESIFLDMSKVRKLRLSPTAFKKMCNLKLLKFYYTDLKRERKVYISQQGLKYLSNNLSYLHWDDYPSKSVPSNFCPVNLVELSMRNSAVKQLWNGVQDLVKLKWLDLSNSQYLIKIPNLSQATNLESMRFGGCRSLVKVPSSIRYLSKLRYLNLMQCQNLGNFPSNVGLKSLTALLLTDCSNMTKFPEISASLLTLSLDGTAIEEIPSSVDLSRIISLGLTNTRKLERLPINICKMKISFLDLTGCLKLESFPEILETMKYLKSLYLSRTSIEELPSSIKHLVGLIKLQLNYCKKLKNLPSSIKELKSLEELYLINCSNFTKLPEIPGNLRSLNLRGTAIEQVSSLIEPVSGLPDNVENLKSLKDLHLGHCNLFAFPSHLTCISSLTDLDLSGNNFETIPASIKELLELERLHLSYCKRLQSLPELPPNLQFFNADSCSSLEAVSSSFTLGRGRKITYLFTNCLKLDQNAISHILAETQLWIKHRASEDLKVDHEGILDHFSPVTICLPGSEIPEWFSYQSTGSSVTTQLPHLDDFVCFALCAVVALEDYDESVSFRVDCKYNLKSNYGDHHANFCHLGFGEMSAGSDNMFLGFTKTCLFYKCFSEASFEFYGYKVKKCGVRLLFPQTDQIIYDYGSDLPYAKNTEESTSIMLYQPSSSSDPTRLSLRCGVNNQGFGERMVEDGTIIKGCCSDYCYNEAESSGSLDLSRETIMIKPSSPCDSTWLSLNCGVIDQGFGEPMQEDGTTIKRCRDDHHNYEAEPSGSLSSEQEEEKPHPKRLKRIIMTNRTLLFKSKVVRRKTKRPWINQPTVTSKSRGFSSQNKCN